MHTRKILSLALIGLMFVGQAAQAQLINYDRRGRQAGTATTPTRKAPAVSGPSWKIRTPYATTRTERRYDFDRDGKLQPAEVVAFLNAAATQVRSRGSIKADSGILRIYDADKDGNITTSELAAITRDIR